ncbi:hypothetical protein [Paenibacillus sp. CMAA1364]
MMEMIIFLTGCFVLYIIILLAINHSDASKYLKRNNQLLKEINVTLKKMRTEEDNKDYDKIGLIIDEKH